MPTTLTQWILAGMGLLIALLLVFVFLQRGTIKTQRDNIASLTASVAVFESAQETNLDTIGKLRTENARWAKVCAVDRDATWEALEAITAERDRLQSDLAEASRQREVIYVRNPEARRWRDTAVPVDVADQLFR